MADHKDEREEKKQNINTGRIKLKSGETKKKKKRMS